MVWKLEQDPEQPQKIRTKYTKEVRRRKGPIGKKEQGN